MLVEMGNTSAHCFLQYNTIPHESGCSPGYKVTLLACFLNFICLCWSGMEWTKPQL